MSPHDAMAHGLALGGAELHSPACNLPGVLAWHRAHGPGITCLIGESGAWSGAWVADRSIGLPDSTTPDELGRLRGTTSLRAVRLGAPAPTLLLLDRDGTIIIDRHYLNDAAQVALLGSTGEALRSLARRGTRLVVVSNQSGIGRGRITPAQLDAVHLALRQQLEAEGVRLDGIYWCPHRPEDGCDCRKPAAGLARRAARELELDLTRSAVVGDKPEDMLLAKALAVPGMLVTSGVGGLTQAVPAGAEYLVRDLADVAAICLHPAGLPREAALPFR